MPHDLPDFGATSGQRTVFQMTDLAELAARLGSIVTFDRRGDVLFLETFESGCRGWSLVGSGAGEVGYLSAYTARSGMYSLRLVGGKTLGLYQSASRQVPALVASKLGLEFSFCNEATIGRIEGWLYIYDGAARWEFRWTWDDDGDVVRYWGDDEEYHDLESHRRIAKNPGGFNTAKLVIDGDAHEYVRLLLNGTEYDLSGLGGYEAEAGAGPYIYFAIFLYSRSGENDYVYIDDVIVTQNEP